MLGSKVGPIAAACVLLVAASAAGAQQRFQPVKDSFAERLLENVPHSGTRAVGLVASNKAPPSAYGVIHVRADAPVEGTLCATVSSVDGRYTARGLYTVKSPAGTLELAYPTKQLAGARYHPGELAVSVRLGERCNDPALLLLPAGWQPVPKDGEVGFAVNAGAGTSVFTIANSQRNNCLLAADLFRDREPAAFTHVCMVSASRLQPGGQIRIFREVAGSRESEIIFPLFGLRPAAKPGT